MYFKTVILLVNIRFISLPKVIKKMKSTPKKSFFYEKRFEDCIYPNHFQKQNENQTFHLGVESRFVKKGVFPQNVKTMSYD